MDHSESFRKCSVCKKDIAYNSTYYQCSVSSCRKYAFCSVECWDVHSGVMNHKSAGADECQAPSKPTEENAPRRIIANQPKTTSTIGNSNKDIPIDILVVASKYKAYVKAKHDMNTSANVMPMLSDIMRVITDNAIENARREGRKTLMDRDFTNVSF